MLNIEYRILGGELLARLENTFPDEIPHSEEEIEIDGKKYNVHSKEWVSTNSVRIFVI